MVAAMTDKPSVALIGAGAMGGALLKGWLAAGSIDAARSAVFDPNIKDEMAGLCAENGVAVNEGEGPFDAMVLAVKPQAAADVLPPLVAERDCCRCDAAWPADATAVCRIRSNLCGRCDVCVRV